MNDSTRQSPPAGGQSPPTFRQGQPPPADRQGLPPGEDARVRIGISGGATGAPRVVEMDLEDYVARRFPEPATPVA